MRRLNSETGTVAREPKSILDELAGTLRQTSSNCYRGFGTHVPTVAVEPTALRPRTRSPHAGLLGCPDPTDLLSLNRGSEGGIAL
jgi:hypothetical protein